MKRNFNGLCLFILGLLYNVILVSLIAVIIYKRLPLINVLLFSFITYGIINIISLSKIAIRIFFGLSLVISCFITYACWADNPIFKPILQATEGVLALWYSIYYNYNLSYSSEQIKLYANITLLLIALLASVLVIILFKHYQSFYILSLIIFLFFLFSWYMSAIESRFLFIIYLILTILAYINKVYLRKKELGLASDDLEPGRLMFFSIPLALITVFIVFMIPKSSQPIQWTWLDRKINDAYIFFEQRFSTQRMEYFSLSSTGFGNEKNNRLGGSIRPRYNEVMRVKADKRSYLRGASYNWYEDNSWVRSNMMSSGEIMKDFTEIQMGWSYIPISEFFPDISDDDMLFLEDLSQGRLNDILFPVYSMEIEIRNLITNNLFIPLKAIMPIKLSDDNIMPVYELVDGIAMSAEPLKRGSSYKIDYIQPMYGEELFKKALSFSRKNLYKDSIEFWETKYYFFNKLRSLKGDEESTETDYITNLLNIINGTLASLKTLYSNALQIEENYTKLPDNIPHRVKDLAYRITKDSDSDYEKVIAVEKYLRENYTYTLNPKEVPYDRDFVDYFLFEEKEGYCTYYATSMAILLRLSGVPARYVEGYVLPPETSSDMIYTITNMNAHAWVEVYFEGFGWLVFEPTVVYAGIMDFKTISDYIGYNNYSSYEEMMNTFRFDNETINYTPIISENENGDKTNYSLLFLCIIIGLVVVCILINLLVTLISMLVLKVSNYEKKILLLYKKMTVWLSHTGYKFKPGETARDFAARIDEIYYFSEHNFREITEVFSKVRYGGHKVNSEEYEMVKNLCDELNKKVLKELGIRRFIPLRRIFLGI